MPRPAFRRGVFGIDESTPAVFAEKNRILWPKNSPSPKKGFAFTGALVVYYYIIGYLFI